MWVDLTGKKFDKLTVIKRIDDYIYPGSGRHEPKWLCECDCDDHNKIEVIHHNLLNGHVHCCKECKSNKVKDMIGKKFGHLTVIEKAESKIVNGEKVLMYLCECDCDKHTKVIVSGHNLRNGHTTSCGCAIIKAATKHGYRYHPLYSVYRGMVNRCYDKNHQAYKDYGGRGIYICDEWLDKENGVKNFVEWSLSHGYEQGVLSINRIDNDGPYSPDNCEYATDKEQARNRRSNVVIEYKGEKLTATEWGERLGIEPTTIMSRIKKGYTPEDALGLGKAAHRKTIILNGTPYTLGELSELYDIPESMLYDRIFKCGWPVEKAIIKKIPNTLEYDGNCFTYEDWDRIRGYIPRTVYLRLYKGFTPEEALNGKEGQKNQVAKNAIFFIDDDGNPYSQSEWEEKEKNR